MLCTSFWKSSFFTGVVFDEVFEQFQLMTREILLPVLPVSEEEINGVAVMEVIDDPDAAALSGTGDRPAKFPQPAGAANDIARLRVLKDGKLEQRCSSEERSSSIWLE
jgi:hypothetical protein